MVIGCRSSVAFTILAALFALVVLHEPLAAGDGGSFVVGKPLKRGQKSSGLAVTYVGWGWSGSGYREITLLVNSVPPAPRERTLSIEAAPNSYFRSHTPFAVSKTVTIPKGHNSSTIKMLIPQHGVWNYMRVDVLEDGERLPDVSMDHGTSNLQSSASGSWLSEAYPTMLFIDSDAPALTDKVAVITKQKINAQGKTTHDLADIRSLAMLLRPSNSGTSSVETIQELILDGKMKLQRGSDLETLEFVQDLNQLELVPPQDLPDSWLGLTSTDVIFISLEDLDRTSQQQPGKLRELLRFISTGATLVVHGCGDAFSRIAELTDILERHAVTTSPWHDLPAQRDSAPGAMTTEATAALDTMLGQAQAQADYVPPGDLAAFASMPAVPPSKRLFRTCELGFGAVIAVAGTEPFYGQSAEWHWLFGRLKPYRWMWYQRHGLSRHRNNDDFWNFLIPGIGAAPVKSFLVLITGFAVAVGPVTYWLLRRSHKLYLLLVVVPAASAVLTCGMLVYVLFHDGLSTRMRCRSFTCLDKQYGTAVSWSRQSYYCGLAPGEGVAFPADAAVFPIDYRSQESATRRRIRWRGDHQQLARGYLRSRTLSQFMVIHPQKTNLRVDIRQRVESGILEAVNRLGVPIDRLVVCDDDGMLHLVKNLPAGDVAAVTLTSKVKVAAALAPILERASPQLPDKFDVDYHTRSFAFQVGYGWTVDNSFSEPSQETSVLERSLRRLELREPLPTRTYWAVTSQAPECVPVGVAPFEEIVSCHVIQGHW